jgi:hypothetical protein
MHSLTTERGGTRLKVYLWFLVLFLVVHVALKLVPMYMDYTQMEDTMSVKASVAQGFKDEEIMQDLVAKAKELDLPLTADDFIIQRNDERRRMKIATKSGWNVEVHFLWGVYVKTFHFAPVAEEQRAERYGI